jgi:hypothetical protein
VLAKMVKSGVDVLVPFSDPVNWSINREPKPYAHALSNCLHTMKVTLSTQEFAIVMDNFTNTYALLRAFHTKGGEREYFVKGWFSYSIVYTQTELRIIIVEKYSVMPLKESRSKLLQKMLGKLQEMENVDPRCKPEQIVFVAGIFEKEEDKNIFRDFYSKYDKSIFTPKFFEDELPQKVYNLNVQLFDKKRKNHPDDSQVDDMCIELFMIALILFIFF